MSGNNKQTGRARRSANGNGAKPARVGVRSNNGGGNGGARQRKQGVGRAGAGKQAQAAAAYASSQKTGTAQVYRNGADSCRIIHRELVASVTGTVAFAVGSTMALNPGMAASFPWLSTQAAGWERYKWNALRFCYYTRTGSNTPGSVLMAPDFDAADAAPASEVIASSYQHCEEDAPWKDIKCILPARELMGDMKEKFVRAGSLAANQDIKTYDAGNFYLCTVDGTAVSWGKLWVEYDVTLITPQVPDGGFQASGALRGSTALTAAAVFGTAGISTGPVIVTASGNVLTISNVQIGQEISVSAAIAGTVVTVFTGAATSGLTLKTDASGGTLVAAAGNAAVDFQTFIVTALNPTLTYTVTATTITSSFAVVSVLAPIPVF